MLIDGELRSPVEQNNNITAIRVYLVVVANQNGDRQLSFGAYLSGEQWEFRPTHAVDGSWSIDCLCSVGDIKAALQAI